MKVYIVTSGEYSDYGIRKVFLNKEKAELYCKYHQDGWDNCEIEEWETSDEYEPSNTYYKVYAEFEIKKDKDVFNPDGFYRTVFKDFRCDLIDNRDNSYNLKPETYRSFWSGNRPIVLVRYYREQDYTPEELKDKIAKIGYDICAQVTEALSNGATDDDIEELLKGDQKDGE